MFGDDPPLSVPTAHFDTVAFPVAEIDKALGFGLSAGPMLIQQMQHRNVEFTVPSTKLDNII